MNVGDILMSVEAINFLIGGVILFWLALIVTAVYLAYKNKNPFAPCEEWNEGDDSIENELDRIIEDTKNEKD